MTYLGYGALTCATLFYLGILALNYPRPNLAGENAMGYGLGIVFTGLGFTLGILVLMAALNARGDFNGVSPDGTWRWTISIFGTLAIAASTFFCAVLKWETMPGMPHFVNWLAQKDAAVWIPPLALFPALVLLNATLRQALPAPAWQVPLGLVLVVSTAISLGLLVGWMAEEGRQQKARIEALEDDQHRQHDRHLADIEALQPTDGIVGILSLTGRFHDEDVKSAALSKIKSRPGWEDELLGVLESASYFHHAYTFLDGNRVDHPERFAEPLRQSILRMADEIAASIKDSNNLQDWHFEHYGIERLLRAIDEQFGTTGTDYVTAVQALQQALNTRPPERFKNVRFNITPKVDAWLKQQKK